MSDEPSPTEDNGRDAKGRFGAGNKLAKGNPHNQRAQAIRAALFRAVKPADIREAVEALMKDAKAGDRLALAEILDRTIGTAVQSDLLERVERLEASIDRRDANKT